MGTDNQPPVETIQGEARAREVIQADRDADADPTNAAREAIRSAFMTSVSGGTPHPYCVSLAYPTMAEMHKAHSAFLAFQSEARAVPSGGEREIIAAGREWIKSQVYSIESDGLCPADIDAGSADHSWRMAAFVAGARFRALPHQADREAIARIISPEWFGEVDGRHVLDNYPGQHKGYQEKALAKADAILALSPTPSAGRDGGGDDISAMAQFLCDRLDNLDWQDFEDTTRDFMGHVDPALSRLKKALAALPPATEKAEK